MAKGESFPRLCEVMDRLLGPGGCPWDQEQTLTTLRTYLLEETHEVLEALARGDVAGHLEELGDLLMQVVFHAALRERESAFAIDDVVGGIVDKLVSRHPHVFAAQAQLSTDEVLAQWEQLKAAEKPAMARLLDAVPKALPGLTRAAKLGSKAAKVGFDWPDAAGARAKVLEELAEVDAAVGDGDALEREVGDLLFAAVNLARKLKVDPELAIHGACVRFHERFSHVEQVVRARGSTVETTPMEQLDQLWEQAKRAEAASSDTASD